MRHNWDCIKKDVDIIIDDTDRDWLERDVVKFLQKTRVIDAKIKDRFTFAPRNENNNNIQFPKSTKL